MNTLATSPFLLPPIGLGTWPFGGGYDWGPLDEKSAQNAVAVALENNINFIDTAPIYGDGESETFLGRVLAGRRKKVLLASKCGLVKNGSWTDHDLRPQTICHQLDETLVRLKTDWLDLYQIHYPDPKISLEDAVWELARLQQAGKIRAIGLCNVSAQQIEMATKIAPISTVQNEFSLLHPTGGTSVFKTCQKHHISFIGYGVLCGGILSGKYKTAPNLRRADARNYFYKCYRGDAFIRAQKVVERVKQVATRKGCSPCAVAVAWALNKSIVACVLCGARSATQIMQNAVGAKIKLTPQEIDFLEKENAN